MDLEHPDYPTLKSNSLTALACCAQTELPMRLLMEQLPDQLQGILRADWGEQLSFCGTPLVLASALGRTRQVKLLPESGIHPDILRAMSIMTAEHGVRTRFWDSLNCKSACRD